MGRFWNMLATAVFGGAKTEINQVLWASKLQTNISIKLLIEINPCDQRLICMGIYECLNLYKAVNTDIMLLVKDKSAITQGNSKAE